MSKFTQNSNGYACLASQSKQQIRKVGRLGAEHENSRKQKAVASLNSIINRSEAMDIKGTTRESHPFKTCQKNAEKGVMF